MISISLFWYCTNIQRLLGGIALRTVKIGNHQIGAGAPVFVIAEAGANHEGDIDVAERMISKAAEAGAHSIKFQTYKADKLVTRTAAKYWYDPENKVNNQYEMFDRLDKFGEADWKRLVDHAATEKIIFLSSAWDEDSADLLDNLGMVAFKIGSADITSIPLIRYIARKGKPIILSTGASTIGEVESAVRTIRDEGLDDIVLLHCILSYPTQYQDTHLEMMTQLQQVFPDVPVGYSDHTIADANMTVPLAAAAMGARAIEKHFTLDKSLPGNDHYLSMDPIDLKAWTASLSILFQASAENGQSRPLPSEVPAAAMARRSLVSKIPIPTGTEITLEMLTSKRPGTGVSPRDLETIVGRYARKNIAENQTITWDMI
jgi:sialic acid synthase SpsE